ncbi:unnamed protein product [Heligmosomoides polygyrus]|uniref:Uncharacterized protein n=1 Tax=Heligmosomoides polygyrus TaxID=6339 RepID=A0A183FA46_HELPZ|nr:unnamed protein product [Heligmosomoides polygyrus]
MTSHPLPSKALGRAETGAGRSTNSNNVEREGGARVENKLGEAARCSRSRAPPKRSPAGAGRRRAMSSQPG